MDNGEFPTSETPLAAYLLTAGFKLLTINYSSHPYIYHFSNNNNIKDAAQTYIIGLARVEPASYQRTYKQLVDTILNKRQWGSE